MVDRSVGDAVDEFRQLGPARIEHQVMAPMELYNLCSIGGCELALFLQREDGVALGSHYMHGGRDPLSS